MADKEKKEYKSEEGKTLSDVKQILKDINARAAQRKYERDAARAAIVEARRKRTPKGTTPKGSSIQGLQTSFGKKIIN